SCAFVVLSLCVMPGVLLFSLDPPLFPSRRSSDLESSSDTGAFARTRGGPTRAGESMAEAMSRPACGSVTGPRGGGGGSAATLLRSEEHTSELQSRFALVCRLLLEKKQSVRGENVR